MYICCNSNVTCLEGEHFIETENGDTGEIFGSTVVLTTLSKKSENNHCTVCQYFILLCREYKLFPNERITLLSQPDSLLAIQLSISSIGKSKEPVVYDQVKEISNFIQQCKLSPTESCEPKDTEKHKILKIYTDLLTLTNQWDIFDVYVKLKEELSTSDSEESDMLKDLKKKKILCFGEPTNDLERSMLKLLCFNGLIEIRKEDCSSEIIAVSREITWLDDINYQQSLSQDVCQSISQLYIERVFICYIELLVNTRSELSLATIFNIPDRELDHIAFTALKHTAQNKKLPMYQTAVSHIIKLRLGSKAYAPELDCELAPYVKGLGELVTFIQKLQCILEEVPDIRVACQRVVSNIKICIKKCKIRRLKEDDVEEACQHLQDKLAQILDDKDKQNLVSPDKPASDGGSQLGRRTVRVLRQLLDADAASKGDYSNCFLEDFALNPTTPSRIPCLLSQFRSPDVDVEEEHDDKKEMKKKKRALEDRHNIQDYSTVAIPKHTETSKKEKLLQEKLNSVIVIPSKTIVHAASGSSRLHLAMKTSNTNKTNPAVFDKENIQDIDQPNKRQKTCLSENVMDSKNVDLKSKKVPKKATKSEETKKSKAPPKSCRRKLLPQIKGQQNIASFFRI